MQCMGCAQHTCGGTSQRPCCAEDQSLTTELEFLKRSFSERSEPQHLLWPCPCCLAVHTSLMAHSTCSKRGPSWPPGIGSLPNDILGHVLKFVDFKTRLEAQKVCRRWNQLLSHPECSHIWHDVPCILMSSNKLTTRPNDRGLRYMAWLGRRAAGLEYIKFSTERWLPAAEMTEARFFAETLLPHFLGQLELQNSPPNCKLAMATGKLSTDKEHSIFL